MNVCCVDEGCMNDERWMYTVYMDVYVDDIRVTDVYIHLCMHEWCMNVWSVNERRMMNVER